MSERQSVHPGQLHYTEEEFAKLPLSTALEVALFDLEQCEGSPEYAVGMYFYFENLADGRCSVCLAGASLHTRYHRTSTAGVSVFEEISDVALMANESLQHISIRHGWPDYGTKPNRWKSYIRDCIADLKARGQ